MPLLNHDSRSTVFDTESQATSKSSLIVTQVTNVKSFYIIADDTDSSEECGTWFAKQVADALTDKEDWDNRSTYNTIEELFADLDS